MTFCRQLSSCISPYHRRAPELFQKDTKYLTKVFEALKKVYSMDVPPTSLSSLSLSLSLSLFTSLCPLTCASFDVLQKLPMDVSLAVQECLSLMAAAYRGVQGQSAVIIEALILENIYSVRYYHILKSIFCHCMLSLALS